jgi:hypothetical protein
MYYQNTGILRDPFFITPKNSVPLCLCAKNQLAEGLPPASVFSLRIAAAEQQFPLRELYLRGLPPISIYPPG